MFALSDFMVSLWRRWQRAIHSINEVVATILMTLTYAFAVTPVSLIFKMVDSDPLDRGFGDPQATSYWKSVERDADANDIRRVQRQY